MKSNDMKQEKIGFFSKIWRWFFGEKNKDISHILLEEKPANTSRLVIVFPAPMWMHSDGSLRFHS